MSKIMLVNVTHVEESRVAVLEDGVLSDYEIETINRAHLKGNIHNAVVESVHPSLEAAFVRIGPDLKGFLPLDEVNFKLLPQRTDSRKLGKIGQHLQQGQKIMAQVVKEPYAGKPPTISTYFSLPGRHLVLMPGVDSSGISRKIENQQQRDRLKKVIEELKPPEGFGLIVRTAGMGQTKVELQRDMRYLLRLWESIQRSSQTTEFPGLVYREADLVIRTIRDHLTSDISEVWIDSKETYEKALGFVRNVMPNRAKVLKLYTGDRPQFNKHNLEEQIERIYMRRVPLPSGGEIVIDGTEALTAVDVNSARSKKKSDLEETSLQTNVEAAAEIARQLRLRDLGGLVVIDFIDMNAARNRGKVEKAMRDALRGDKAKYDVTRISKLGLMEIARQRLKGAKMASSYATCPVCDGHGLLKNIETSALASLRKLQTRSARGGLAGLKVGLPPEVATWMLNHKREELLRLEQRHSLAIEIEPRPNLLRHESEFVPVAREKGEEPVPDAAALVATPAVPAQAPTSAPHSASSPAPAVAGSSTEETPRTEGERKPRRRRSSGRKPVKPETTDSPAPAPTPAAATAESADSQEPTGTPPAEIGTRPDAPPEETEGGESRRDGTPGEGRPRRRRRRRRGGRSATTAATAEGRPPQNSGEEQPPAEPPAPAEVVVPRGVRSDELMPAASGSRNQGGNKGSGGRRRKRSSSN